MPGAETEKNKKTNNKMTITKRTLGRSIKRNYFIDKSIRLVFEEAHNRTDTT